MRARIPRPPRAARPPGRDSAAAGRCRHTSTSGSMPPRAQRRQPLIHERARHHRNRCARGLRGALADGEVQLIDVIGEVLFEGVGHQLLQLGAGPDGHFRLGEQHIRARGPARTRAAPRCAAPRATAVRSAGAPSACRAHRPPARSPAARAHAADEGGASQPWPDTVTFAAVFIDCVTLQVQSGVKLRWIGRTAPPPALPPRRRHRPPGPGREDCTS